MFYYLILFVTLLCCLGSGLMAGLFFSFSTAVMTAFSHLSPKNGQQAMVEINKRILNGLFLSCFFGTALTSSYILTVAIFYSNLANLSQIFSVAGSMFYLLGTFLVTVFVNVPLNNQLALAPSNSNDNYEVWENYLRRWTRWNHLRTISAAAALVCYLFSFRFL